MPVSQTGLSACAVLALRQVAKTAHQDLSRNHNRDAAVHVLEALARLGIRQGVKA